MEQTKLGQSPTNDSARLKSAQCKYLPGLNLTEILSAARCSHVALGQTQPTRWGLNRWPGAELVVANGRRCVLVDPMGQQQGGSLVAVTVFVGPPSSQSLSLVVGH